MDAILHKAEWVEGGVFYESASIELPDDVSLERLQELVGGYIEIVRFRGTQLIVDEEGLMKDKPLNIWAAAQGMLLVGNVLQVFGELD